MSRRSFRSEERGVALLLVVTILVAMLLVALPFSVSMRQGEERTQALGAQQRAASEAAILARLVALHLQGGLPSEEQARREIGATSVDADPMVDSLEEITPDDRFRKKVVDLVTTGWLGDPDLATRARFLASRGLDPITDDRGSIWSVEVQDAQARIHVEGTSPFLLGNLLGGALLAEDIDASDTEIAVEHVSAGHGGMPGGFTPTGGFLRIAGEVVRYESFDGKAFKGCKRGDLTEVPLLDNRSGEEHKKGTPVVDYVAYKLATHLIARNPGRLTPFRTLEELRDIASWGGGGVLAADRIERLLPYLTVWARREIGGSWVADQLVTNSLPDESSSDGGPEVVSLRDRSNPTGTTRYLRPGVIVRLSDGLKTVYQTVARIGDAEGRQAENKVHLAGSVTAYGTDVTFDGGRTTLSAWAPHPININTASREVLYAVLANVHMRGADTPDKIVTPELALRLVDLIVNERKGDLSRDPQTGERTGGPFRTAGDYGRFLADLVRRHVLTRDQQAALYLNAINPNSASLGLGTTSWCFRTLDVYHVECRVTVNDRSGQQVAESGLRQVLEVGPGSPASWVVDSQAEFEERLAMGSGAKWTASFPYGVAWRHESVAHVQPALRGPPGWLRNTYPDDHRGENLGDVRLEPFRMQLPGAQLVEHFGEAMYTEGWFTGYDGPWTTPTTGSLRRTADGRPQPFTMSFWWRPYSDGTWTAFDVGMERFQNRLALFVTEGEGGRELVFRACGSTLEPRGAEIYVPLDRIAYKPGDWYHIEVACRGEDPASMRLLVDGIDLGIRRGMSYLSGDLSEDATEIGLEQLEQFPPRGCVRIGTELIEYDERAVDSLRSCRRGTRGTGRLAYPAGTPVELLGYALPLTVDVMRGGLTLASELKKFSAVRVVGGEDTTTVTVGETPFLLRGYKGANSAPTLTTVPMWGQDEATALGAFQDEGIALLGCWKLEDSGGGSLGGGGGAGGSGSEPIGGWEVVHYRRNGNQFSVTRYTQTAWQESAQPYFLVTRVETLMMDFPCFLVPISVHAAGGQTATGEDYLDPAEPGDREVLGRYYPGEDTTAFVLLGTDTPDGQHEVIAYNSIDRELASAGVYFVKDRAISNLTLHFFNDAIQLEDTTPTTPDPVPPDDPDDDEPDGPLPPGGIPPGLRTPGDGAPAPPSGGASGGSSGSPSEPGVGGGGTDDVDPEDDDSEGEAGSETAPSREAEGSDDSRAEDATTATPPEPDEPPVDHSGGGEDESSDGDDVDPVPPLDEAPGSFDEAEERTDEEDTSNLPWTVPEGPETARQRAQIRGVLGSYDQDHRGATGDRNDRFLPCFRVFEGVQVAPVMRAGAFDRITITDGQSSEGDFEAAIRWGHESSGWCALEDFIDRRIRSTDAGANIRRSDTRGFARILKFPCGELPMTLPDDLEFGRSAISSSNLVTAFLDEVHVWRHPLQEKLALINDDGIAADAERLEIAPTVSGTLPVAAIDGASQPCGAVMIDGEIVIYREISVDDSRIFLEDCERGQMGSRATAHAYGAGVVFLPDVFVSYLVGGLEIGASTITLADARNWPREGCVRIVTGDDGELIHYTRRSDTDLIVPESLDADEEERGKGLFRGRFGSTATTHEDRAIAIFQPFRYWDRFTPRTDGKQVFEGIHAHPESSYLELGAKRQDGWWHGFTWTENLTGAPVSETSDDRAEGESLDLLDILVLARFNPLVPWDTTKVVDLRDAGAYGSEQRDLAAAAVDSLFLFDDPGDVEFLSGRTGNALGVESTHAEFRVYFAWKVGAWYGNDRREPGVASHNDERVLPSWWKRTPWFQSLDVTVSHRTRVLYSAPLAR